MREKEKKEKRERERDEDEVASPQSSSSSSSRRRSRRGKTTTNTRSSKHAKSGKRPRYSSPADEASALYIDIAVQVHLQRNIEAALAFFSDMINLAMYMPPNGRRRMKFTCANAKDLLPSSTLVVPTLRVGGSIDHDHDHDHNRQHYCPLHLSLSLSVSPSHHDPN